MDLLMHILNSSQYGFLTAFVLGLMTAISPCPLATNISAIGFISRDIENKKRVFLSGIVYTLGRAFSYSLLAVLIYLGASKLNISMFFQGWGEKLLGPVLIIIGLFMLDVLKVKLPGISLLTQHFEQRKGTNYLSSFLLGSAFALAFCPYSAVLYFAMLIPVTVANVSGLYLPLVFAFATGLPVIVFAWLLAYAIANVGRLYNSIRVFELWFRRVVAVIFIIVGMYYSSLLLFINY